MTDWRDHDLVAVSLFAGVGGIDAGLEQAGIPTAVQVEVDPACRRVLEARFPAAVRFGDVREVTGEQVRAVVGGRRLVLAGGFPCQDVSVAGRRAGMAGERSGLYVELVRLADELDPDWVVVENVPGLLSADLDPDANGGAGWGRGTAFAVVLADLAGWQPGVPADGWRNSGVCSGPGRSVAWRVLDARHLGVAQRRRRVFVVACPRDRVAPAAVLLEPEGVRGDPPPGGPPRPRFAEGAARAAVRAGAPGAGRGGGEGARAGLTADEGVVTALSSALGGAGADAAHAQAGWIAAHVVDRDVAATLTASDSPNRGGTAGPMQLVPPVDDPNDRARPVTVRGRDGVGQAELGDEPVMNALRAGDGSSSRQPTILDPNDRVTHALTSEGADASEDGTGRGTPLAVGTWRKSRRAQTSADDETWVPDDVANTLNTFDGGDTRATELVVDAVAFAEGSTGQAVDDVAPTLQAEQPSDSSNRQVAVVAAGAHTHTTEGYSPTVTGSKEGPPAVAFSQAGYGAHVNADTAPTLQATGQEGNQVQGVVSSFTDNGSDVYLTEEQTGALCSGGGIPGQGYQAIVGAPSHDGAYADAAEADAVETLSRLRSEDGEEAAAEWLARVVAALWPAEVLRPGVHGEGVRREADDGDVVGDDALPREEGVPAGTVREVRQDGPDGRASSQRRPSGQPTGEPGPSLPELPSPGASSAYLRGLWRAAQGSRLLRETLAAVAEVRRSVADEGQPAHPDREGGGRGQIAAQVRRLTPV